MVPIDGPPEGTFKIPDMYLMRALLDSITFGIKTFFYLNISARKAHLEEAPALHTQIDSLRVIPHVTLDVRVKIQNESIRIFTMAIFLKHKT